MNIMAVAALTCIVSIIDMVVGFGTSTLMVPVLIFFVSPLDALFISGVIDFFNNVWKIALFPRKIDWSVAIPFSIAGAIGAFIGAAVMFALPVMFFKKALGALLITYVIYSSYKPTFSIPKNNIMSSVGGLLYGFFAGLIGMGGPIRGACLTGFNLSKGMYAATNGVIAGFVDAARVGAYFLHGNGIRSINFLLILAGFIGLSFLSALVGRQLINKLDPATFRKIIMVFLLVIGVRLLFFA